MAVFGALLGKAIFGDSAFGRKPEVPELAAIDPTQVQKDTVAGNQASLPALQRLGGQVNQFNQGQQLQMLQRALEFALPGGLQRAQAITESQMRGELPGDVTRRVAEASAAQGFASGFMGSGLGRNLTARDLGLTSLQLQQQGMQNFQSLGSMVPQTPLFDVTSMFFTPGQRMEAAFRERSDIFNRNLMQAQVKAAPDPFAAAMTQAFIQDEQQIMELIGSVAGMAGKAAGAACWVARKVYGENNPKWRLFRMWLFTEAPSEIAEFYLKHGEQMAQAVTEGHTRLKELMDQAVNIITRRYGH